MGSFNPQVEKVLSPNAFVHVVLRTDMENFKTMTQYYKTFLGAHAAYENESLAFLTYDEEHHRIAIAGIPNQSPKPAATRGLEHIAFSFDKLEGLALAYQQRKAHGITPYWCVNHGPTTSMYYKDPDNNNIETQVDNLTSDEATAFMMSSEFAENPWGVDFDPEELVRRVKSGEDEAVIKKRPNIGPRGPPDHIN